MPKPLVSYLRVNAREQSRSGLASEAQREAIARFVQAERFELVAEFVEVETGKGSDALSAARSLSPRWTRPASMKMPGGRSQSSIA